jgi:hypothetical protein
MSPQQQTERSSAVGGDQGEAHRPGFSMLGLSPEAGADLVELAYQYHVRVRGDRPAGAAWIGALDRVRQQLRGLVAEVTPLRPSAPVPDQRASSRGWWFIKRGGKGAPPLTGGVTPYQMLRVDAGVEQPLLTLVYRHLLRAAARAADAVAFEGLERAYALVGTPEARAVSDERGLLLDAAYAAPVGAGSGRTAAGMRAAAEMPATGTVEAEELISAPVRGYA